ncbi:MAG: GTP 3',8-cyclase MoaA [Dehalococcoidia bacterium]|nr:GTP 3',8-cyclase MoaA [Dehalococcoidia bacterium]
MVSTILDSYRRRIDYMRISVTDRCDLRCSYCTASRFENLSHDDILRYEEIERVVRAAAELGVKGIRLTGGEPLVRPHLDALVRIISDIPGIEDISLTTNATHLAKYASALKTAGLKRVNISLDTFKPERFQRICGRNALGQTLDGISAAQEAGLYPVKTNTVVMRGVNDDEIADFAQKSLSDGWHVRYIEEMPLTGPENTREMVSIAEIKAVIENAFGSLEPCGPAAGLGPAKYYRLKGASGTVGFIAPMTHAFCEDCNRLRLTADGKLRLCLLRDDEVDLRSAIRRGADLAELKDLLLKAAQLKKERYDLAGKASGLERQMWQIGG